MVKQFCVCVLGVMLFGCQGDYLPKPKGYNRIDLPEHEYTNLPDTLPYQFEYSTIATLSPHESWITERYWIDINYENMDAMVQITYKPILNKDSLMRGYYTDSYKLTSQHNVKAYAIDEMILELPNGNFASVSSLEGEVPTPFQFHVSDSNRHFIRGALYFETATKNDSLAPVISYLKQDVIHLLETLQWDHGNKK
ncbi:gliding motility lipoprotein GldD [Marinoscillum sp. MHG1-6]|uniref:gliding motility lipoprotein GldD n=1 Tax=Marinoscillum sp. MHG1-6 TaxID=2959627 RepID=UPI002157F305|nr:gliding motility lipoprotein GldD [Marinoscillum sp. MHG1-6]